VIQKKEKIMINLVQKRNTIRDIRVRLLSLEMILTLMTFSENSFQIWHKVVEEVELILKIYSLEVYKDKDRELNLIREYIELPEVQLLFFQHLAWEWVAVLVYLLKDVDNDKKKKKKMNLQEKIYNIVDNKDHQEDNKDNQKNLI
jgi:hypothetical protein